MGSTGWILLHEVHFGIQGDEGPAVFKLWLSELPWLFTSSVAIEEGGRGAQEKEGRRKEGGKKRILWKVVWTRPGSGVHICVPMLLIKHCCVAWKAGKYIDIL